MRYTVLAAMTLVAAMAAPSFAQNPAPPVPSIVTSGEATVTRAPDQAFVTVAVETRAKAPRDAQRLNAEAMTAVQQRLTAAGIARDAIRTTGYTIQQEFDFTNGRRIPREYVARNGVEVRLDAVERVGEVLDLAVQAGATNVGGVRFDLKDRAGAEREALQLAVGDARKRADAIAAGAGLSVGRILRIDEGRPPVLPMPQPLMRMSAAAADAMPTPIESGSIEIHASVTLTVEIR
jgi:uncharacterized protein YggE